MIFLSSTFNDTSLASIAMELLHATPPNVQLASELAGFIPPDSLSLDVRLRLTHAFLVHGQIQQAKRFTAEIDAAAYIINNAPNDALIHLLFSILLQTDRLNEVVFLLESDDLTRSIEKEKIIEWRFKITLILLKQNQIEQVQSILSQTDLFKFVKAIKKPALINWLVTVLPFLEESAKFIELFEAVEETHLLEHARLTDLKLSTANSLIMTGKKDSAKIILESISFPKLTNPNHMALLGLYYTHLSLFKQASTIFKFAEQQAENHPDLHVYMGVNHWCLNEIDQAMAAIDKHINNNEGKTIGLFWKAKFLNYQGQHEEACHWVEMATEIALKGPAVRRCFCLVEKGNTLRALGKFKEALTCYQMAIEKDIGAVFWLWIACFEYAMTLIFLGKIQEALVVVLKGCSFQSYQYNSKFNPCNILSCFLARRQGRESDTPILKWVDNSGLWPWPYMPYKIWMLIFTGIALEENDRHAEAKRVYSEILRTNAHKDEYQSVDLQNLDDTYLIFHDHNLMNILQSKFWSYDFFWKTLFRLPGIEC